MPQADGGTRLFLGSGAAFPFGLDADGALRMIAYEQHVAESVHLVLATRRGERVMRPDFGSGLAELAFAPLNGATVSLAAHLARDALLRCEPRIDVVDVSVVLIEEAARLDVTVEYRVRRTDSVFNLVYPFSLERGADARG